MRPYQQGIPWMHLEDLILPYYLIFLSLQLLQGFLRAARAKGSEKVFLKKNNHKSMQMFNNNVCIHLLNTMELVEKNLTLKIDLIPVRD